jgi:hypothetical protein
MAVGENRILEAGCRISFGWISALAYTSNWNLKAPLLNRRLKRLVKERGYGEHIGAEIAVEFSDGWRPYQLRLVSELTAPASMETRSEAGSMGDFSREARVELPDHRPVSATLAG